MFRFLVLGILIFVHESALAQKHPTTDSTAVTIAAQSVAAMTGGVHVNDVTLTGSVTWIEGSDNQTGSATFRASGTGESRVDLGFSAGTRSEIRDASTGLPLGKWIAPDGTSGAFAFHNCQTDAAWFFSSLGSLNGGPNVIFTYVGQEQRNGEAVQHLLTYVSQPAQPIDSQQLSAMDFYLDAATLLPSSIVFSSHPDVNSGTSFSMEVDFANYQSFNGIMIPTHIQRYQEGSLMIDAQISGASFNTGLDTSIFSIN